jgi:hypothetical protein
MSEFFKQLISQLAAIWRKTFAPAESRHLDAGFFHGTRSYRTPGVVAERRQEDGADAGYVVLYSNLELEEAGAITESLQKDQNPL